MHELADRREDAGDGLIVGCELLLETYLELIEALEARSSRKGTKACMIWMLTATVRSRRSIEESMATP